VPSPFRPPAPGPPSGFCNSMIINCLAAKRWTAGPRLGQCPAYGVLKVFTGLVTPSLLPLGSIESTV